MMINTIAEKTEKKLYDIIPTGKIVNGREVGKIRLNPHEGQLKVWDSTKRFILALWGTQSGKTALTPHWLKREIERTARPFELNDYLVVTSTYPLLNLKLLPTFIEIFEEVLEIGKFKVTEKVLYFNFNDVSGRIIFCSAENPESMESATAKAAVLDECGQVQFKREAWEAARRRLSLSRGRVLMTTTLYPRGGTWLKTEFYDPWKRQQQGVEDKRGQNIDITQYASTVNPKFSQEEMDEVRETLPDWKYKMLYLGEFATARGLIYDAFDVDTCLINRYIDKNGQLCKEWPVKDDWPRYVGMDFGTDTACLFFAIHPTTGDIYLDAEYCENGKSTQQNVDNLKEMSQKWNIVKRIGGKGDPGDDGWRGEYTRAGWPVQMPSIRSVEVGIQRVYDLFKQKKLYLPTDAYGSVEEVTTYSYKEDENGKATGDIANKQRFHRMDCFRYILGEFNTTLSSKYQLKPVRASYGY
jgi:phage terminase large subunit